MLRRHRAPGLESRPADTVKGMKHLSEEWVTLLRWLGEAGVEHVVLGPAGEAIRGRAGCEGPLAIAPAPYDRNLDRLGRALRAAHARSRDEAGAAASVRFSAAVLAGTERWALRCEETYELDLEIHAAARYSELLYDAGRFEIEPGLSVEVGSHEDLERRNHTLLTGEEPEIRISRGPVAPEGAIDPVAPGGAAGTVTPEGAAGTVTPGGAQAASPAEPVPDEAHTAR